MGRGGPGWAGMGLEDPEPGTLNALQVSVSQLLHGALISIHPASPLGHLLFLSGSHHFPSIKGQTWGWGEEGLGLRVMTGETILGSLAVGGGLRIFNHRVWFEQVAQTGD